MTYGVIDVGSNTIRLCIYKVEHGEITSLFNNKTTAGLIGYVNDGELSRKGIKKACDVLNTYKKTAAFAQIKELYVFATASLRNITNSDEAVRTIYEETGLKVDVLSGYDEAALDFEGAVHAEKLDNGIMVDIGGGSTEILYFCEGKIRDAVSLNFGSLSMYRTYVSKLFPKKSEAKAICRKVEQELKKVEFLENRPFPVMIGIGGTIRAVKKFNNDIFGLSRDNNIIIDGNLEYLMEELQDEEKQTLSKVLRVAPDRIHTLIPGMLILRTIFKRCQCKEIHMSSFGVREGYLYKKVMVQNERDDLHAE